ncbi:hypothetical protein ABFS83_12G001000 [Erythranthe nasuta]
MDNPPRRNGVAFTSHMSVYDDVFRAPRKFDIPTLAPRLQDYSEIFAAGFHASRSSSIPFLRLPLISDDYSLHLDVRSPDFDYTEVFGDFRGLAVTASFDDLLGQSSGGYDHDDNNEEEEEEESSHDPWYVMSPSQSGCLSVSDELDPINGSDKSYMLSEGDVHQSPETVNKLNASYSKSVQMNTETVLTGTARVTNFCALPGYTFSPCESSVSWNGEDEHCSVDLSPLEKPGNSISPKDNNKSFITVSDISLRTKPSRLPPPSRPPPALVVENREFDRSNSKLKPSKLNAFDRVADDSASLFFDVEVDENKNAEVKYKSNKEETSVPVPVTEETLVGFGGVRYCNSVDNSTGDVAWEEETEYFEVVEKNISRQGFDMVEDYNTSTRLMNQDSYRHRRMTECDIFNQNEDSMKLKVTKEAPKCDEESNQLEMTTDHCERGHNQQQEMQNTRLIGQKGFQENVKPSKLADFDTRIPETSLQLGDSEKLEIKHIDETVEGRKESKGNVTAGEAKLRLKASPKRMDNNIVYESEAGKDDTLVKGNCSKISKNKAELQDGNTHTLNNTMEFLCLHNQMRDSNNCAYGIGVSSDLTEKKSSEVDESHEPEKIGSTEDDGGQKMKTQFISKRVDTVIRESLVKGGKVDDASSVLLENSNSQKTERKDKNIKDSVAAKDRTVEERVRRRSELENEQMRKVEEEREREREREKDRMAVNKAAVEARERSYIDARERAERANAEVRQRAMTGARERLDKTSMDARIRVERAAVERANAEARHRAAEKSMAQNGLPYSSSLPHFVSEGESPQRCKARLERYKRTAERAANALAEKNRRDLLAQRETEERNRVAESLDAELKRWSSGKERNLRALLSTLQYILGPDSGWQPVPLTEVITTGAVKKAYRKATLFVHPDKLQQRGATIQQKYICEKVFDLLKEAWNKFNSEER